MAKTKIVATIGPASSDPTTIAALLRAGMDVARVNFSHGNHSEHKKTVETLRKVAEDMKNPLAILGDLQGPKLRIGKVRSGGFPLEVGAEVAFTPHRGQPGMIHLPHPPLLEALEKGVKLLLGDGEIELVVTDKQGDAVICRVTVPGTLHSRKGVFAPGTKLPFSSITPKDREDLKLICKLDLDFIALSFVSSAADIHELRELMQAEGKQIPIIAKIERREAITNLIEIRDVVDGMMVARGDLGIEMGPEEVPVLQKQIIKACNEVGKPVITATQMLESMTRHPHPTRAEASDVANAILDGTDAVMLSAETAMGKYPIQAVRTMDKISEITERAFPYDEWNRKWFKGQVKALSRVTQAVSQASHMIAQYVEAKAIVTTTVSGFTAQQISRHRPATPIIAVTPSEATRRRMSLLWGTTSHLVPDFLNHEQMVKEVMKAVKEEGLQVGDRIIVTSGVFGNEGQTNSIQIYNVE